MRQPLVVVLTAAALMGCGRRGAVPLSYDPPGSTITTSKPVDEQVRRAWQFGEIGVRNDYDGARLNALEAVNDTLLAGHITPENAPVNNSAWFGFKIWSQAPRHVWVRLEYADGDHRYVPKLSSDGHSWASISADSLRMDTIGERRAGLMALAIGPDTLWVSGQEKLGSQEFRTWIDAEAGRAAAKVVEVGVSTLGRPIQLLDIGTQPGSDEYVLIISRQHPPEVTGSIAVLAFVERLLLDDGLARRFRARYRTLVVPLMNPDGVDNGHWRHNAGGVDLNRDWLDFNQPETRAVSQYFVQRVGEGIVRFAADFHSTQEDVFYTTSRDLETNTPGLVDAWLADIAAALPDYAVNDDPSGVDSPVSKAWFYKQFKATSLTYEVGDEQERSLIRAVSVAGAESMMQRLLDVPRN
jgi:cytosolic carboxypeptidase protein 6